MIPKKIHYCWFGTKPLPKIAKKCIASWKKYCPDYEIIEWNENNFDVNCCNYTKEAYQAKKYAFVSDVARLKVLIKYGGIYMDIDQEILKPIDSFLKYEAFCGFTTDEDIGLGILGSSENLDVFKEYLAQYDDIHFIMKDGKPDLTIINDRFEQFCKKYGFVLNNTLQTIRGITFFPSEYFYAKNHLTQKTKITENTYTMHHFYASWCTFKMKVYICLVKIFGKKCVVKMSNIKNKIFAYLKISDKSNKM